MEFCDSHALGVPFHHFTKSEVSSRNLPDFVNYSKTNEVYQLKVSEVYSRSLKFLSKNFSLIFDIEISRVMSRYEYTAVI